MDDIRKIYLKLEEQEKRINNLERQVNINSEYLGSNSIRHEQEVKSNTDSIEHKTQHKTQIVKKSIIPSLTFTQVITFLGVLGVIIGLVSFFFYAVANHWIGEGLQILIGITVGIVLFGLAYKLHEKNEMWSMFVFGGSLLTEFISIGVGVLEYEVLPKILGFFILLLFIIVSIVLSLRFNSRIIAYYALVGGYIIPLLSGLYDNELFIISYLLLLAAALSVLSVKYNWADLRLVSGVIQLMYIFSNIELLTTNNFMPMALTFVILNFLIYNFSTLIYSIRNEKGINQLDSITMNFNSFFFLILFYNILEDILSLTEFGICILPLSFLYLAEIQYLKKSSKTDFKSTYYSIFSSAIITLNLSIYFILEMLNIDFFIIVFAIEWILFSLLSKESKDSKYLNIVSYVFFALFALWYLIVVRFNEGMTHATVYMLFYILLIGLIWLLIKKDINRKISGAIFLTYIYVVIYSFSKYLVFFDFTKKMMTLSLSIMWLIYTLTGIRLLSKNKYARILLMCLLGLTVLKIAFDDLLYLSGVYRIIGFTVFGILLLIGGFFLKNETTD